MKNNLPILTTALGGFLGSLYGYLSVIAVISEASASGASTLENLNTYQSTFTYIVVPIMLIVGGLIGKWRAAQIGGLSGWRKWVAMLLLGLIVAVIGYEATIIGLAFTA